MTAPAEPMWRTHHWPEDYQDHCLRIGSIHLCRRCSALYPIGFLVGFLAAAGLPLWPDRYDPALIWVLCVPATVAFVGEATGVFSYRPRWQAAAMAITALGFGKALSYELLDRWSGEFWGPVAVFGGIWFAASAYQATRPTGHGMISATTPSAIGSWNPEDLIADGETLTSRGDE